MIFHRNIRPGRLRAVGGAAVAVLVAAVLVAPAAEAAGVTDRPTPGAAGLGDRLYPTLGNGGYQVENYDLDLRYPTADQAQRLDGTVTLLARATQSLSRFDLDFSGESVGAVSVDGAPAAATRSGDELVITPARPVRRGRLFSVTIRHFTSASSTADPSDFLSQVFVSTPDGTVWAGQPDGAHRIFPCNDHPSDKAGFTFRVDVPAGVTALANGVLVGKRTAAGRTVWSYRQSEPMATELAQVTVGALTVTSAGRRSGVELRDVTPTRLTSKLTSKLAVEADQLDWMRARVGEYPFPSYGSLVADSPLGFALETQTVSLYDLTYFTTYPQGVWDPTMLHELAHQWFGDSVAPLRWTDVWQNEGHATWYEVTYAAEKGFLSQDVGSPDLVSLFRTIYSLGDRWRAQLGPVGSPRGGRVLDLFNANVYYGGALVLYALQQEIGAPAFARLERTWVSRYRGRSASTADFIALASQVSGRNLTAFLSGWLYGTTTPPMPGHPDWKADPVPTPTPGTEARRSAVAGATAADEVPMKNLRIPPRH